MKNHFSLVFIFIFISILISCSSPVIDDYQNNEPRIDLPTFFSGDLVAYGIVRDRSGKVIRYFNAVLKGDWVRGQNDQLVGTLDEVFWFDDGERQTRLWTMKSNGQGDFIGTAGDVKGDALIQARGNAIKLSYELIIPYKGSELSVSMDDWMYQVSPGVVLNETLMTKWGFEVGKVTLVIMRADVVNAIPKLVQRFDYQ